MHLVHVVCGCEHVLKDFLCIFSVASPDQTTLNLIEELAVWTYTTLSTVYYNQSLNLSPFLTLERRGYVSSGLCWNQFTGQEKKDPNRCGNYITITGTAMQLFYHELIWWLSKSLHVLFCPFNSPKSKVGKYIMIQNKENQHLRSWNQKHKEKLFEY